MILPEVLQGAFTRDGFDAPHTGRHAVFLQNLDQPDLTGRPRVRAAAEFSREVTDSDDAYPVPVFFAEKRDRLVLVEGDINWDILDGFDFLVAQDFFVDEVFYILQLFVFDSGEMREVEAEMVGCNQRTRLLDVPAEDFAQPGMQQVCGGVVAHG